MKDDEKTRKDGEAEKEKLPLDARLLSESVIEFNISRRSVGLYPPGHAIITNSIERAYELLEKLFELRTSITLGIAKDSLVIDDNILDKKNPVYAECALSFHDKGLAGITFIAGLEKEEIVKLHELLTLKDGPSGKELIEQAEKSGINHIRFSPIDYSTFRFVEDAVSTGDSEDGIWKDYVYGLLSGKLTGEDYAGGILSIPPEKIAEIINKTGADGEIRGDAQTESYDRVITSYLRSKGEEKLSPASMDKLFLLIDNLNPNIKKQFLSKTFENISVDIPTVENMLRDMTADGFEQIVRIFAEHDSMVPDTLKNVIDKLTSIKADASFGFDMLYHDSAVVHDIELGEELMGLFDEDHFKSFVSSEYQGDLDKMLKAKQFSDREVSIEELNAEGREDVIDKVTSEVMLEVLEADIITRDDYLNVLTKLSEFAKEFVETGRFEEALAIYNTLYTHTLSGAHTHEAASSLTYFFRSEPFISSFVEAIRLWGRNKRQEVIRLARVLKAELINPLIDALQEEKDASIRRFLLSVLSELGTDVVPEAAKRLKDERWFVVRNMLYLIRECGNEKYVKYIRKFAKHADKRICVEAVKALLHFKTNDSIPYLKVHLQSKDEELREQAIRLSGTYRVREAIPALLALLQKKDLLGSETLQKISIVKALGDIGDPRALEALNNILQSKSVFYKRGLKELKMETLKSLSKYPPSSVKSLIEVGRKSDIEEVRSLSDQMMTTMFGDKKGRNV
jgi:hypothetical protein